MGSGCCSGGDCGGGQDTPGPTPPRHDGPSIESVQTNKNNNNNINNNNNDRNDEEDDQGCCGTEGCDGDKASRGFLEAADATAADDCDDETCCAADNASIAPSTKTLECCNTNEEHCDEKCIIAAAAAECEKTCDDDSAHDAASGHEHVHDQDGRHGTACNSHLAKAFEQYSAYLETARCICRSILERGLPAAACCNEQSQQTKLASSHKEKAKKHSKNKHGHTHGADGAHAETTAHGLHKHGHHGMKHRAKATKKTTVDHHHHHHRHNDQSIGQVKEVDEESDCCGSEHDIHTAQPFVEKHGAGLSSVRQGERDVEKDAAGLEHISLVVDGMTCSGCGNKMERTLKASSAAVSSVRVNFVMGSAEFSLDPSHGVKAEEIIRIVERGTGFRCARMSDGDQTIDVLVASVQASTALSELQLPGVTQVVSVDKKRMRLTYDPAVVGPRTLLEKIGELSSGLAPNDDPSVSSGRKRLYDQLIKTCVAAVLTIPVLVLAWGKESVHVEPLTSAAVSIALATLVQMVAVPDFYKPAISALVHSGSVEMDMLVVISITAAYVYSLVAFGFRVAGRPLETEEFFETSTLLITLVLLGRLVAAFARMRAVAAVSLRSLQASTALLVGQKGEAPEMEMDARLLQYGDRFKVLPHSTVPTDGIVTSGVSEVDESMLTGEAVPVPKERHDTVVAGTVNGSGTLVVQLTRLPGKNTVTDIAKLVEEAANSKPKIQDVADRVAGWFVPVVTVTAILVTVVWIIVGIKVRSFPADRAVADAVTYAVAVLAISCPCALGLAVPMVLVVAGGIAARGGVVIKSAESTERARKVTDVVFDKTGTITESELDMAEDEYPLNHLVTKADAAAIARAVASGNKHPVSVAVAKHLEKHTAADLTDVHVVPGFGIEAKYKGFVVRAGNPHWTQTESHSTVARLQDQGMTIFAVSLADTPIAFYSLRTRLRVDAAAVVKQLQRRGISVHLVSGDQKRAVEAVAAQVGIPQSNVASQYTPAQKREYVAQLMAPASQQTQKQKQNQNQNQNQNQKPKVVMFVGDGTNDAVAVAQADVGVQLAAAGAPGGSKGASAAASEVTRGAADVVLLSGLGGVLFLLDISRSASLRMKFNFAWSAVYNVLAILLASGALVAVRIPPAYAGLGEIVSVLPVIIAAATMFAAKKGCADGS
ncbi:hypothetical protein MCOR27_002566 [Pyricularia oryzae]|nr:hypothetical protein MCOR26_006311 [Pyricularia oryzae]KAI6284804.1 hypothetical protein MCOR27_002566 [Pyricularia oryzae]KAI6294099.1 hypothetical protein MCOR29_011524 [Pyricularia oryzae]KAI6308609.1 hypothetical protein MCOR30_011448 [Pyricularia oryzae]KAI6336594.1 hypothetical protein MCOR28_008968 [Pyricularia oryzae]